MQVKENQEKYPFLRYKKVVIRMFNHEIKILENKQYIIWKPMVNLLTNIKINAVTKLKNMNEYAV